MYDAFAQRRTELDATLMVQIDIPGSKSSFERQLRFLL
jgi:hypothetical protein